MNSTFFWNVLKLNLTIHYKDTCRPVALPRKSDLEIGLETMSHDYFWMFGYDTDARVNKLIFLVIFKLKHLYFLRITITSET